MTRLIAFRPAAWIFALTLGMIALSSPAILADDREGAPAAGATWPQWRGPHRDGQVGGATWPDRLDENSLERLWRLPLGPSYSGPIVSEKYVFTTETRNKETEVVHALDRRTGEKRWRAEWKGALTVPFFAASNGSWIRSTPAFDGARLYVAGIRDVLVCLDATTG